MGAVSRRRGSPLGPPAWPTGGTSRGTCLAPCTGGTLVSDVRDRTTALLTTGQDGLRDTLRVVVCFLLSPVSPSGAQTQPVSPCVLTAFPVTRYLLFLYNSLLWKTCQIQGRHK